MTQEPTEIEGTLIRGADGAMYFIPQNDLQPYRLPDTITAQAQQVIADTMDVQGFDALLTSLTPPVFGVEALQRPRVSQFSDDEETVIVKPPPTIRKPL
jgi:hypothetical protein